MTVGGFVCFLFVCFFKFIFRFLLWIHVLYGVLKLMTVAALFLGHWASDDSFPHQRLFLFVCLFFLPTHEGVTLRKGFCFESCIADKQHGWPPLGVSFSSSYPWAKYWTPSFPWFIHECVNVRLKVFKVNGWIRFVVRKCFKCSNRVEKHRSTNPCTVKLTFVSFMMIINVKDWYYH